MKKKILFLVGVLFIAVLVFFPSPTRAIIRDQTISTIADKDSYVTISDPNANFGGRDWLTFGFDLGFSSWNEAYFHFNFSDKPINWIKAEISLDVYYVSETFNMTVCLINKTWNEYEITWYERPEHREIITTFPVAEEKIYKFNITNYIEGRDGISVCLNISDREHKGYAKARSKEGFYSWNPEDAPQLIWTYPETVEITVISPKSSDVWEDFYSYDIKWTSKGSIEHVKIQLYKGSTFIEDITYTYTENDGEYEFYVFSSENYKGTDYRIKITDYDDSRVYDYSDYFSINEEPPSDGKGDGNTQSIAYVPGIGIIIGVIGGLAAVGVVLYLILSQQRKKRIISPPIPPIHPYQTSVPPQTPSMLKYCPNCGTTIPIEGKFCKHCGFELSNV